MKIKSNRVLVVLQDGHISIQQTCVQERSGEAACAV